MNVIKTVGTAVLFTAVMSAAADAQPNRSRVPRPAAPQDLAQDSARRAQQRMPLDPAHPASMVLRLREQLELTDAQVQRLETMRQTALPTVNEAAMLRARADYIEATRGEINAEAARTAIDRMNRLRTDQQVARLRARQDVRSVLDATQKSRLDQIEQRMGDRTRMRAGGAPGARGATRPGMRGGARAGMGAGMRGGMPGRDGMRAGPRPPAFRGGPGGPNGPRGFGPPGAGRRTPGAGEVGAPLPPPAQRNDVQSTDSFNETR